VRLLVTSITSALFVFLLCTESLFGQANRGRITGTVSDASGAVVPNTKITIIALENNRRQSYVSDGAGEVRQAGAAVKARRTRPTDDL
jgi:hypothetical protein